MSKSRQRIAIVATVPFALLVFMRIHIEVLAAHYDVTLITSGPLDLLDNLLGPHVRVQKIIFKRKISLFSDVRSLISLLRLFRQERFDVVHSLMPKTGLLAMLAAKLTGVQNRVHIFTGQVWATKTGPGRQILKWMDTLIAACASQVLADSFSQRDFLISENIVRADKIKVLAHGSICGVDIQKFRPDPVCRTTLRAKLGIEEDAIVLIFLGRINRDKGILDLAGAFLQVLQRMPTVHLLIVGPDECGLDTALQDLMKGCPGYYHRIGYTDRPESYLQIADIFCHPSYREGFGSVLIEAAATGVPAVASRIVGLIDAVVEGETGLLFESGDISGMRDALISLAKDRVLRQTMAAAAVARAHDKFSQDLVSGALLAYYKNMTGHIFQNKPDEK